MLLFSVFSFRIFFYNYRFLLFASRVKTQIMRSILIRRNAVLQSTMCMVCWSLKTLGLLWQKAMVRRAYSRLIMQYVNYVIHFRGNEKPLGCAMSGPFVCSTHTDERFCNNFWYHLQSLGCISERLDLTKKWLKSKLIRPIISNVCRNQIDFCVVVCSVLNCIRL